MPVEFEIHELQGVALEPRLADIATLRIRVFREFPYLYDGDHDYERNYLRIYQQERALVALVIGSEGTPVGATTCLPLDLETAEFQEPFLRQGMDPRTILYLGESVLLPEWRGRGIGKTFFDLREAHARKLGLLTTAFCAVDRPNDHPLRPSDFRPLDAFWTSRGYVKQPSIQTSFSWKETGETRPSPKTLTFWTKSWAT